MTTSVRALSGEHAGSFLEDCIENEFVKFTPAVAFRPFDAENNNALSARE
jgi:hypothetical protein